MKKPSVKEVAKRAGVGTSTVSRVLNGYVNVADDTRQRVQRAVEELDYTPNLAARGFRTGQTNAVSVILPMIGPEFYRRLLVSIQQTLDEADLDTALFPIVGDIKLKRYQNPSALPYYADGLLIASLDPDRIYPKGRPPFSKPIVLVDAHHPDYHSVYLDNFKAGSVAADYAVSLQAPIAYIDVEDSSGVFESPVFNERRLGLERTLERQGIQLAETLRVSISVEHGRQAARLLLAKQREAPLTVIAACDELALGALKEFEAAGWQVGQDIFILGFDDQPFAKDAALTTIRQPIEEMGRFAAEILVKALAGSLVSIQQCTLAPQLIKRRSA